MDHYEGDIAKADIGKFPRVDFLVIAVVSAANGWLRTEPGLRPVTPSAHAHGYPKIRKFYSQNILSLRQSEVMQH
ncbi:hypothetical protein OHS58_03905 [Amycolatopsis sp. NBC_00348]|uniref:hypothetical protein n=1 Tax=Amycolatopsis sp. NBC_00348 TaxID=2975956 RepID=UPI002E254604